MRRHRRPARTASTARGAGTPASVIVQRRIEWSDTDASGMFHNTAAFRLIEVAEATLLERLGFVEEVYGRMPRVHIEADFERPLKFRDLVDAQLAVAAVGETSITYAFEMRAQGEVAVRGTVVAVLLPRPGGRPVRWLERHRALLLSAGPQPPERLVTGSPDPERG